MEALRCIRKMQKDKEKFTKTVQAVSTSSSDFPPDEDPVINEPSNKEIFFQIVKEGSVEKLKEFEKTNEREETFEIANSFNENGVTPLLLAITESNLLMTEYLIWNLNVNINQTGKFFWNGMGYLEGPPLFAAIIFESQKPAQFPFPIHRHSSIVAFLIDEIYKVDQTHCLNIVLESVRNCKSITRQQKVEILELIGSAYILKNQNYYGYVIGGFNHYDFCGQTCWIEALRLRESPTDGESVFHKVRYTLPDYVKNILGFENLAEFKTLEELNEVIPIDPFKPINQRDLNKSNKDQLHYQAILTSLRILGQYQQDMHPFLFFLRHVINIHLSYLWGMHPGHTSGLHQRIISLGMRVLQEMSKFLKCENYAKDLRPFDDSMNAVLFSMSWILDFRTIKMVFNFDNVMDTLNFMSDYVEQLPPKAENVKENKRNVLHCIYDIVAYFVRHLTELNAKKRRFEKRRFTIWLHHFNRITRAYSNKSLLHFACHYYHRLNADVIEMLLDGGANPNDTDDNNDAPAHYLADRITYHDRNFQQLMSLKLLVGAGAHLFQVNNSGETALEKFRKQEDLILDETIIDESCMESEMRLTCLCAEVLRKNKIQYDRYPPLLVPFLVSHGAKQRTSLTH